MVDDRSRTEVREMLIQSNPDVSDEMPGSAPDRQPLAFHRQLPGYSPTPLLDAPTVAGRLGVRSVRVKDEAERLGLPAFKVLGASWATYRALANHIGIAETSGLSLDQLEDLLAPHRPLKLAAATDGNHGRAVARMARLLGLDAEIFVPEDMVPARRAAIAGEGATVTVVHGTYDEAVARAAREAAGDCLVIADTAWPGYEDVPRWVIDGYSTILWEVEDEMVRLGESAPDLVAMQIGVGAFASSVTRHFRRPDLKHRPTLVGVEPLDAACALRSIQAGEITEVPGPHRSIMAGLNCGSPSPVAWPVLKSGIDLFLAVDDEWAREAMRLLATDNIVAGESGAAGLAGLLALTPEQRAELLGIGSDTSILIFNTEGATDPDAYARIVGDG